MPHCFWDICSCLAPWWCVLSTECDDRNNDSARIRLGGIARNCGWIARGQYDTNKTFLAAPLGLFARRGAPLGTRVRNGLDSTWQQAGDANSQLEGCFHSIVSRPYRHPPSTNPTIHRSSIHPPIHPSSQRATTRRSDHPQVPIAIEREIPD